MSLKVHNLHQKTATGSKTSVIFIKAILLPIILKGSIYRGLSFY